MDERKRMDGLSRSGNGGMRGRCMPTWTSPTGQAAHGDMSNGGDQGELLRVHLAVR